MLEGKASPVQAKLQGSIVITLGLTHGEAHASQESAQGGSVELPKVLVTSSGPCIWSLIFWRIDLLILEAVMGMKSAAACWEGATPPALWVLKVDRVK